MQSSLAIGQLQWQVHDIPFLPTQGTNQFGLNFPTSRIITEAVFAKP